MKYLEWINILMSARCTAHTRVSFYARGDNGHRPLSVRTQRRAVVRQMQIGAAPWSGKGQRTLATPESQTGKGAVTLYLKDGFQEGCYQMTMHHQRQCSSRLIYERFALSVIGRDQTAPDFVRGSQN